MPATPVRPPEYRRREPEKEPLYQILAGHLETFLQQARTAEHRLPLHVEKEMRAYLECGMLAYGFVRARCEDCGASRAVAFSCKKRGFCPSCSVPAPAGCRAVGGGRRYERSVLRPSPGVGGPAGPGVGRRPQPMRSRWRAPEDHRRPDRSGLDPDLSGGGRAAGGAPAEGPAAAAVRVRGLTSPPFAPGAVSRREECVLNGLIEYRIGPATGPQTTKPYCEPCQTTCKRSSASLPCPLGVFGALTRGPKRCLILPILFGGSAQVGKQTPHVFQCEVIEIRDCRYKNRGCEEYL